MVRVFDPIRTPSASAGPPSPLLEGGGRGVLSRCHKRELAIGSCRSAQPRQEFRTKGHCLALFPCIADGLSIRTPRYRDWVGMKFGSRRRATAREGSALEGRHMIAHGVSRGKRVPYRVTSPVGAAHPTEWVTGSRPQVCRPSGAWEFPYAPFPRAYARGWHVPPLRGSLAEGR